MKTKRRERKEYNKMCWVGRSEESNNLLCFRLILARPVEKAMTTPKQKREENGEGLEGGETDIHVNALKMASRTHAVV